MKEKIRAAWETAKEKTLLGLGWLFGGLLIVLGLVTLIVPPQQSLVGVCFALAGVTLLPSLTNWLEPYHVPVNAKIRTATFVILVLAAGQFGALADQRQENQEAEEKRQAIQGKFREDSTAILEYVERLITDSAFRRAEGLADRYLDAGATSTTLRQLRATAIKAQKEIKERRREDNLLAEVRQVPASEIYRNRDLYSELAELDPDNQTYERKLETYQAKVAERERRKRQLVARYGAKPEPSAWDGSYDPVERFLEPRLHDPESLEWQGCSEPEVIEGEGWRVYCEYRANNAFGAQVLQAAYFTIRQGRVVDMTEVQ